MKKYIYIAIAFAVLLAVIGWQFMSLKKAKEERDIYKNNTTTLLNDVTTYKTKDSLNAVQVGELSLRLSEFKKYRSEDAELIKSLQTKNRDLQGVSKTQLQTIYKLKGQVRDSIVYVKGDTETIIRTDTLKCLTIKDKWFDLNGCIDKQNAFNGNFESRDTLIYVETVKYKRFLGFLWKTGKIKDRKQDIVSKNPHTKIVGAEFITIRD